MNKHIKVVFTVGLTAAITATSALSQPLISVDEFGNGTIGGSPLTWQTSLVEPFSAMATLSYNLPFPGFRGDVVLMEPNSGLVSDLIRFDGNSHLFFFSDASPGDPADSLADVGLPGYNPAAPTLFFNETGPEGGPNGLWGYLPTSNDPGGNTAAVMYDFISDVPEPGALTLLAAGLGILGYTQRRRKLPRD